MNFLSFIEAKRDGRELTPRQISDFVSAFARGQIPDYQVSAFLMAIFFRGLTREETTSLTLAMRDSGDTLQLPQDSRPIVDKHSTGGVGDKVSLPLAPLLACLGFRVPMISGRGLGITGGTLDKLDSIPGFQTALPADRIIRIVQEVGCVICGQTERMVPADKGLYALRDVTGTVPSQALIVSSILSKKLAENLNALVLDVKFGSAAFMSTVSDARSLAKEMVMLGCSCGVKTRAILTNMDAPLGAAAGNWLEVREAVQCLEGKGPPGLELLVVECAAHLLAMTGKAPDLEIAHRAAHDCLASRAPRKKWAEMIASQGADIEAFERKLKADVIAPAACEVRAKKSGYIVRSDARKIGEIIRDLGGGRATKDSVIHYEAGVDCLVSVGTQIRAGDMLGRVHAQDSAAANRAALQVAEAFTIHEEPVAEPQLVMEAIS